jgi:hypothetical protein
MERLRGYKKIKGVAGIDPKIKLQDVAKWASISKYRLNPYHHPVSALTKFQPFICLLHFPRWNDH